VIDPGDAHEPPNEPPPPNDSGPQRVNPTIAEPKRRLSGRPLEVADLRSLTRAPGATKEIRDCTRHGRCRAAGPPGGSLSIGAARNGRPPADMAHCARLQT
jgi:hypothetical protein